MRIKLLSIAAVVVLISSCKKEMISTDIDAGKRLDEISISDQFDWKTLHDINFSVGVSDTRFSGKLKYVISIYAGDPLKGGRLISKGAATPLEPFNTKISLPKVLSEVYIVKTAPDGSKVSGKVAITSSNISVSAGISEIVSSVSGISSSKSLVKRSTSLLNTPTAETSPAIPSDAIVISGITNNGYPFVAGKNYVITNGAEINGFSSWQMEGTNIYVAGTNVKINGFTLISGASLIILNNASVTFTGLSYNGNGNATFKNFGTVSGLGNLSVKGTFYNAQNNLKINGTLYIHEGSTTTNFGSLTVTEDLNVAGALKNGGTLNVDGRLQTDQSSNSLFINSGTVNLKGSPKFGGTTINKKTINVTSGVEVHINASNTSFLNESGAVISAGDSKLNAGANITNNGSIIVKELNKQGSGKIVNNCKLYALQNATLDGPIDNYAYIYVGKEVNVNGGGIVKQYSHEGGQKAMFSTDIFKNSGGNNNFIGEGSAFSVVKIRSSVINIGNGNVLFTGKTYVIKPQDVVIPVSKFSGDAAVLATNYYIAKNSCNDEGNGNDDTPVNPDTDDDGVIDDEDDFPQDHKKAFSANYNAGGYTVAFEDNWPYKGDYDLNDVVITYRYVVISDAQNNVVRIEADYKLLATGGIFRNGAGIQFNIPAAKAKNFVGASGEFLEDGQDSIVVILFKDSRVEQLTWNTTLQEAASDTKEYAISFDIEDGPKMADFGLGSYNPFIWNNTPGYGRGYETHLLGKSPTKLANASLFGTAEDNSIAGRKYSTKDNLPYALEIPTAEYQYPLERIVITDAYLKFAQWVSSGGADYEDWYKNTSNGYRDNSKLFIK